MDSQFNSLVQSYHDNYIQYKVTGSDKYKSGIEASKQGLDSLISGLKSKVEQQRKEFSDFYKSGVDSKLLELNQENRLLQRGIIYEKDEIEASKLRSQGTVVSPNVISKWQYVTAGVLTATIVGLSFL